MKKFVRWFIGIVVIAAAILAFSMNNVNDTATNNTGASINGTIPAAEILTAQVLTAVVEQPVVPTSITTELLFPEQPKMPGNYSGNTAVLRAYIKANMQSVTIPTETVNGTITFKLNKAPVVRHNTVTFYANVPSLMKTMAWGRLYLSWATVSEDNLSYTFPMNNVQIKVGKKDVGWDILTEMIGKKINLSVFVGERNNRVESITIVTQ